MHVIYCHFRLKQTFCFAHNKLLHFFEIPVTRQATIFIPVANSKMGIGSYYPIVVASYY